MRLFLIVVTSQLDVVVASTNVLHPMKNQCCVVFQLMM